jgi:hypothetical protein
VPPKFQQSKEVRSLITNEEYSDAIISGKCKPAQCQDEKQEGTLQLPSTGLSSLSAADGFYKRLLFKVDYEGE